MKAFIRVVCVSASLGVPIGMIASVATAQLPCGPNKLTASDGMSADAFGDAIAIDGDTLVVGARRHGDNGFHSGAAYVYRWIGAGWVEEAELLAPDGEANDKFGRSVAIDGNTIIQIALCSHAVWTHGRRQTARY